VLSAAALLAATLLAPSVHAELDPEELAKIAQNPVGNLLGVPFHENLNLNAVSFMKDLRSPTNCPPHRSTP
jgi:hypothetical protein